VKRLIRHENHVKAAVLGLDVHKSTIFYCLLDRRGDVAAEGRVDATRAGVGALLEEVVGRKHAHVTLEASGLSLWLYDLLRERYGEGRVHMAQAKKIRMIAASSEKNDRNDAWWLAWLTHEGRLPEAYVAPAAYRELRTAGRERIEAGRMRARAAVRLKAELAQLGERPPHESLDSEATQAFVAEVARRVGGARGEKLARGLVTYRHFTRERDAWRERLDALASGLGQDVRTLRCEIPGLGTTLAATILAEAGPLARFRSAKAFARFTGLTPTDRSTGGRTIHGAMSREGSPTLRWALVEAVTHCRRGSRGAHGAVRRWVDAHARRIGKGKARVAAARKLAQSIWRLFALGECFDAAKAFGGAIPAAPSA
jgi:transposase